MVERLGDRFELGDLIGTGGMGRVYRAYDTRLERDVAIKLLATDLVDDDHSLRRFEREARAVAALSHPNIMTLFDYGTDDGQPYLVMELLEGESLRHALEGGPLPLRQSLDIAAQICRGLEAAHQRGIVHRDLKPENVFLVAGRSTKILDFGLALLRRPPSEASEDAATRTLSLHTELGIVAGTLGYMAPEQVRGEKADERADIFAFGALLYEMGSGRRAFPGNSALEVTASLLRDAPSLDHLPDDLGAVVDRCLEKRPGRRYQSARELGAALAALQHNAPAGITSKEIDSAFGGRPAIAVLPFDNLSSDSEQEYLADGIVEDLIIRLSRWRSFPVIARNSTFVYKGQSADVSKIGRELGARYVVQGSVRRGGQRVRVAAQLIDTETSHQLWGEHYDREMDDIFEIQDEVTDAIVVAMHPELQRHEGQRVSRKDPMSLDAWELAHRAWWHVVRGQGSDYEEAKELYGRSLELDPELVWALYGLGMVHINEIAGYQAETTGESLAQLVELAERCVASDSRDPLGHILLAVAYSLRRRPETMAAEFELAIDLDPSSAPAYRQMAFHMALAGYSDRAIEAADRGLSLSPRDPFVWIFLAAKACAHFGEGRYEEACRHARHAVQHRRDATIANEVLAASLAHLARIDEGRRVYERSLASRPHDERMRGLLGLTTARFKERLFEGLSLVGLGS